MFITYNTLFNFFIRSNYNENVFWYFVELLNSNNKSILLFLSMLLFISILYYNNCNFILTIFKCLLLYSVLEYKHQIFVYKNYLITNYIANTTLINGVVLIHPLLIYLTYSIFILFIFIYNNNIKLINKVVFYVKKHKNKLFVFSLSALVLGG